MRRQFWLIDGKLREAAHFLDRTIATVDLDEARYSFSAFLTAFVSVFDATDRTLSDVPGFGDWWGAEEQCLLTEPFISYLWKVRNQIVHEGLNPLQGLTRGSFGPSEKFFADNDLPLGERNVETVCGRAMYVLAEVCARTYQNWWSTLDLPAGTTLEELERGGQTVALVELELGLPLGTASANGSSPEAQIEVLRACSQTIAKDLLNRYCEYSEPPPPFCDLSLIGVLRRRRKGRERIVSATNALEPTET